MDDRREVIMLLIGSEIDVVRLGFWMWLSECAATYGRAWSKFMVQAGGGASTCCRGGEGGHVRRDRPSVLRHR